MDVRWKAREWRVAFHLLAAGLRKAQADQEILLRTVAASFPQALPGRVRVLRERGVFGGRPVSLEIDLDAVRYVIDARRPGSFVVTCQRAVGGVAVGDRQILAPDRWVESFCEDLGRFAESAGLSVLTLERLLVGRPITEQGE